MMFADCFWKSPQPSSASVAGPASLAFHAAPRERQQRQCPSACVTLETVMAVVFKKALWAKILFASICTIVHLGNETC